MSEWRGTGAKALKSGIDNGLLTRLDEDCGQLIKIHCANHQIELAIKELFLDMDTAFSTLYKLIKSEIKGAAEALNVEN